MPYTPEKVYTPQHLKFATQAPDREPTLYFRTTHGSGRLRQQHESGAKVQDVRMHTSHAFFPDVDTHAEFARQVRANPTLTRQEFRQLRHDLGGRHTPTEGFHHFEATFDAHGPTGRAWKTHKSEGTVVGPEHLETLRTKVPEIYGKMTK